MHSMVSLFTGTAILSTTGSLSTPDTSWEYKQGTAIKNDTCDTKKEIFIWNLVICQSITRWSRLSNQHQSII